MEAAQVGESNPPPPGSPQPPEPGPAPAPELAVRGECSQQRVFISQRGHSHTSRSRVERFPTQPLPLCHPHCPCPSLATGRRLQGPQGAGSLRWHLVARSHWDPLQPGAWQAVPSPWMDVATRRGCPCMSQLCQAGVGVCTLTLLINVGKQILYTRQRPINGNLLSEIAETSAKS